uniref:Ribosomal protein S11 n=1 Tax=Chroomonas placoidea TaxID=173977 RepID=A0A2P1G825_9CRYP|nr:ribosomal protein S11 [Chroomonas placoidea]AVM81111.1 ribosomal protein S11 [Chroomonas placoidea]
MDKTTTLSRKNLHIVAIVYIYTSFNNTLITITNIKGQTILFGSAGSLGLKGSKRSTAFAGQSIADVLGKKLFILGFRFVYIQFKGFGSARKSVLKGFLGSSLKILTIKDKTNIAHNGCKAKKKRRI